MTKSSNTVRHKASVTRERREAQNGHRSVLLWFTGLSGSGKSTLAHYVEEKLHIKGCQTFVFDGDNVRHGLCRDLSFSESDRSENIRRISEMSKLFINAGIIALTAFISPSHTDRKKVRDLIGDDFVEIYCDCPIAVCEERDVKGLYKRARAGEIKDFTGISAPYDVPESAEIVVDTSGKESLEDCADKIIAKLHEHGVFKN